MLRLLISEIVKLTPNKLDLWQTSPADPSLSPGKGHLVQVLALHLTPFQQTVAKAESAVTHSSSMSSMHDQITLHTA